MRVTEERDILKKSAAYFAKESKMIRDWPVSSNNYSLQYKGWLYLAVVIGLYSRRVIGWSMQSRMQTDLVLNALLMAVWLRQLTSKVIIHSDQGSRLTSFEWQAFQKTYNLETSMSRRGNCYDNAVAESFFHLLKTERIRRNTFASRYEKQRKMKIQAVYWFRGITIFRIESLQNLAQYTVLNTNEWKLRCYRF